MIGRATKMLITKIAFFNKRQFAKQISLESLNTITKRLDLNVVSFSGKKQFHDQLYSIVSFYKNIGIPNQWTVYNDGTYTENEIRELNKIPNLILKNVSNKMNIIPTEVFIKFPTLLKIIILDEIDPSTTTTLFTDSDILFYSGFNSYLPSFKKDNWYLVDEGNGYFDDDYVSGNDQQPLNLGFLVLNVKLDLSGVFQYIREKYLSDKLGYWTDQTAFDILARKQNFKALPKTDFIVGGKDAFTFSHSSDYSKISLRHFVGPVRHKMWHYPWKKVLQNKE
jgi:hypothetical protein